MKTQNWSSSKMFVVAIAFALVLQLLSGNNEFLVSASGGSIVKNLPGLLGPLTFHLETGYVGVGESENVQLFYHFVKSARNPHKDPLLLWLAGGPGCSSLNGLAYQIGPVRYHYEPYYNGSLPTLYFNQYSWTEKSSIIFVDSPVGTGFSYSETSTHEMGDHLQVNHLLQFLKKWLIDHPEFISNPVYIAGDSYSGITVPVLVQALSNGIEEGSMPPINLQGYILGNPSTILSLDSNHRIPYAHGMALISDELYEALKTSCQGIYYENIDPSNTECLKNMEAFEKCIVGLEQSFILRNKCSFDSLKSGERIMLSLNYDQVFDAIRSADSPLPQLDCQEYEHALCKYWANDPDVWKALHVRKSSIKEWSRCNRNLSYKKEIPSSLPYHVNLSKKGYRSLIFSGDHDMFVPFLSSQAWIRSLNYSIVDDWRSWIVQGQVAGYTRTYSNGMTFATVKGAGHTATQDKPKECVAMFERWINYESL